MWFGFVLFYIQRLCLARTRCSNDFGVKLLILHERKRVGANVILCGDTGTGKSELFAVYSAVVNADCDLVPDLLAELKTAVRRSVHANSSLPALRGLFAEGRSASGERVQVSVLDSITDAHVQRMFDLLQNDIRWAEQPGLLDRVSTFLCTECVQFFRHIHTLLLSCADR